MPFGFGRGIDFFLFNNVSAPRKDSLFHHTHLYSIWWFRYGFAYSTTALVTLEKIVVVEFIGATPATTCFT